MRTATTVELSGAADEVVELVVEAEKLGLDVCWVAEAALEIQCTSVGASDAFTSFTSGRAGSPSVRNHRKARLPRG
jgi:alkanesulfonate monooxygenase SsuD/methylene tetrahydromethanopterin reductase-like flavin-dependent oxidoreductase (luciferase family)